MKCETNLKEGIKKISETKRPGMVVIHKSTCSACNALKPKFLASKEINRLSGSFVVISLADEQEPRDQKWLPDGQYVPRIFFLDTSGQIMREVMNPENNAKFKYYYSNERSLVKSMQRVLALYPQGVVVNTPNAKSYSVKGIENDRFLKKTMKCDLKLSIGLSRMRSSQQPGMIVIYKTWCPVCAELKAVLYSSREIDYLSNYIVIVVLKDEDEPAEKAYAPDGAYIPRIFFTNPAGSILYDIINKQGDPRYKYFYTSEKELIPNIRRVINAFSSRT